MKNTRSQQIIQQLESMLVPLAAGVGVATAAHFADKKNTAERNRDHLMTQGFEQHPDRKNLMVHKKTGEIRDVTKYQKLGNS